MQNSSTGIAVSVGRRREAEDGREVAVLEDPHHRAERRAEGERVAEQRTDRLQDAAGEQEQQDERGHHDQPAGQEQVRADRVLRVDQRRGSAADEHLGSGRCGHRAHLPDEVLRCARGRVQSGAQAHPLRGRLHRRPVADAHVDSLHTAQPAELLGVAVQFGWRKGGRDQHVDDVGRGREVVAQGVADLVARRAGGQDALVGGSERDGQQRRREEQQHRDDRQRGHERAGASRRRRACPRTAPRRCASGGSRGSGRS